MCAALWSPIEPVRICAKKIQWKQLTYPALLKVERDEVVALNKLLDGSNDEYRGQLADIYTQGSRRDLAAFVTAC